MPGHLSANVQSAGYWSATTSADNPKLAWLADFNDDEVTAFMARYAPLSIYKTAMDLAVYFEQVVRTFSRYHKYTLGTDLSQQRRGRDARS